MWFIFREHKPTIAGPTHTYCVNTKGLNSIAATMLKKKTQQQHPGDKVFRRFVDFDVDINSDKAHTE